MFRRTISASIAMVIASIGLAVVAAPAAQASTFRGPVAIGCTSATANNVFTFTRDNTGAGIEQIQIIVRDGRGLILVDTRTSGVVGSQRVLGTYRYTILPSLNPITYTVYSSGGNGLPTVQDYSASVNCNLFESTFVRAAYVDFLGRDPSPQELFNESAALQAGTITRASLVTRLANSDTYIGRIVDKLYVDTLGRRGDSAGVAYWVRRIQSGQVSILSLIHI